MCAFCSWPQNQRVKYRKKKFYVKTKKKIHARFTVQRWDNNNLFAWCVNFTPKIYVCAKVFLSVNTCLSAVFKINYFVFSLSAALLNDINTHELNWKLRSKVNLCLISGNFVFYGECLDGCVFGNLLNYYMEFIESKRK